MSFVGFDPGGGGYDPTQDENQPTYGGAQYTQDDPTANLGGDYSRPNDSAGAYDPTAGLSASSDSGNFADNQYGSDFQSPQQRRTNPVDVTDYSAPSPASSDPTANLSGQASDQGAAFSDISASQPAPSQEQQPPAPSQDASRSDPTANLSAPSMAEAQTDMGDQTMTPQEANAGFTQRAAGGSPFDTFASDEGNLLHSQGYQDATSPQAQQQAEENRVARFGPGSDYALSGESQAEADIANQATKDALVNLDATAQPTPDEMAQMAGTFTTPSGQTVTRAFDGGGYSTWTIPGADDRSNVLYNDNGNWRAVSRDEAARLQQQGATPDQFTSVANAASIAGQAMQYTGTQPDWKRTLEAAGMIAAAPVVAAAGETLATSLADVGGVKPLALGAAYVLKGTGEDLGNTGIVGQGLDALSNLPGIGQYAEKAKHIPIPQFAQNPLAQIEQVARGVANNPASLVGAVPGLAVSVFNNALANAPTKDPMGVIKGFYTEDPVRYAEQSGLQRAGVEMLLTNTVQLHGTDGVLPALSISDPVGKFHAIFAQTPGTPEQKAAAAFDRTNNAVAVFLHTYDLLNPLWFAVETPGLERLVGDFFGNAGQVARAIPLAGKPIGAVGDFFLNLSAKSGADIATDNLARTLAAMTGHPASVPDAIADLYDIGSAFRTQGLDAGRALARDYVTSYGGTVDGALSMGNRLFAGAEQRALLKNGANAFDLGAYVDAITADLRNRNFAFDQLKGAQDAYRLFRQTDAPLIEAQAALQSATSDIRNALYKQAGVDLKAINDPAFWQQTIRFGADTLRTLFLLPGSPALALKKIVDEATRSGTQGVFGVRPADLQLVRTGARFLEGRDSGLLSGIGRRIEDASTVRQYVAQGVPLGPEMTRRLTTSDRAAFSPFRITDKVLDSLVSSPTQHVRLNAAFQELKNFPQVREQLARNFAENIARAFDPRIFSADFINRQAVDAYTMARTATSSADYAEMARAFQMRGADFTPRVPASGMAQGRPALPEPKGTPLPVGENGKAPLPREIAPQKYTATPEQLAKDARRQQERAVQWAKSYTGEGATDYAWRAAPTDVVKGAEKLGVGVPQSLTQGELADAILKASETPKVVGRPPGSIGSAEAGANQPLRPRGGTPAPKPSDLDIAAGGGGGMGRQSARMRANSNPLGQGFGGEMGGQPVRRGYGTETSPRAPGGSSKAVKPDDQFASQRSPIVTKLIEGYAPDPSTGAARINVQDVIAKARRLYDGAVARHDWQLMRDVEEGLLDHAQAAAVAKNTAAKDALTEARVEMFGPQTRDKAARAAHWQAVEEQAAKTAAMRQQTIADGAASLRPPPPARQMPNPGTLRDARGAARLDRAIAEQDADTARYEAWRAAQEAPGASGDVTANLTAAGGRAAPLGLPSGPLPPDRLLLNAGERFPHFSQGPIGTVPGQFIGQPIDSRAAAAGYSRAGMVSQAAGGQFNAARAAQSVAGTERGNRIIGNFMERTPFGELASEGTVNGRQVFAPLVPFAPFHVHTTQFWARYFLEHPAVPFAIARTLNGAGFDEYGGRQIGNRYVSGLLELSTAAKLVHWAQTMYGYATDAIRNPNGNNPLQTAAKIAGMGLFGNEAYVRPFDYVATPAQAALQSATRPLPGKPDFLGNPTIDKREQIAEQGSESPFTGLANLALGGRVPRNVVAGVTNPAQPITNLVRSGAVNAVDTLGGGANLRGYSTDSALAYFAGQYAQDNNLDPKAVRAALYDPKTPEQAALGQQIRTAFNRQQDMNALGKFSPVHWTSETPGVKGIFAPPNTTFAPLDYAQRAGEGGRTAGVGQISKAGSYSLESPDQRAAATARAEIAAKTKVTPESVSFMDYARDYLQRTGDTYLPPGRTSETQALANRSESIFNGEIAANAKRTGAGLPQEQRMQQIQKEGALQREIAPGFTVADFLGQPGNLFDLDRQRSAAYDSGDKKLGYEISLRINDVIAKDLQQHPEVKAYLDTLKNGGVTSTSTATYGYPASTPTAPTTNGGGRSGGAGGLSSPNGTSSNPSGRGTSNPSSSSRVTPNQANTTRSTRTSSSGSGSRSTGSGGGTASGSNTSTQAGNDFFAFYRTLTDSRDKAAVLAALDKAGINPIGQRGVTAAQFRQALDVAKRALIEERLFGAGSGQQAAGGTQHSAPSTQHSLGMSKAEALAAMDAIERAAGLPGGSNRPASAPPPAYRGAGLPGGSAYTNRRKAA